MSTVLGETAIGTTLKLNISGSPIEYILVQQGNPNTGIYNSSFNNGTWLVQKYLTKELAGAYNPGAYSYWLEGDYINSIDASFRNLILSVKVPWTTGTTNYNPVENKYLDEGYDAKVFILSTNELAAQMDPDYGYGGGAKLSYFNNSNGAAKIQNASGATGTYWVRGMRVAQHEYQNCGLYQNGGTSGETVDRDGLRVISNSSRYVRPVFLLPKYLSVLDDGTLSLAAATPPSISFRTLVLMQTQPLTVEWGSVSNADSYTLQRKSNEDSDWVTVYTGADTSFTENAGATWTSVQYQVSASRDGNASTYVQTVVHDVLTQAALVLSGEDGSLGTVTSDIVWSATSDTGNKISTKTILNDYVWKENSVDSGYEETIPIADLTSGGGTIVVEASVTSNEGTVVNETRSWTYTKTPIEFSLTGAISELTQNNMAIWPATVQEAIQTYSWMGGTLDKTLIELYQGKSTIESGTYIGTGTYGRSNSNSIELPNAPKLLIVQDETNTKMYMPDTDTQTGDNVSVSKNNVSWYNDTSAEEQMNKSGVTYNWVAIY